MATSVRDRLARLEQLRGVVRAGGVVICAADETPQEALARSGRTGDCIVMPGPVNADVWERETITQQRRLMVRAAVVAAGGADPGGAPAYCP